MSTRLPVSREIVPAWDHAPEGPGAGPRYVLRREYFGCLVYDRETLQYMPFDGSATALLLTGAGESLEAISFLEAMREEELLDAGGRLAARVVEDRSAPDRLSAPLTVYMGATQGCNLSCGHCQAGSSPGPLGALPLPIMRRVFREMHELGCGLVHITGGEPLLHPEFLPAVDEAFALGLNVLLTTNGTVLSEPLADAIAARPFRCVSVSIDGPDAESNDAIRGAGSLASALDGLALLAARRPVGVTTTLTPLLKGRLVELVRLCEEAGAASISLRPALPSGRALSDTEWLPTPELFQEVITELDELQEEASIPLFHPPEVPHERTSAFVLERFGCVAGNLVCSVTPAGRVSPCALLGPSFDTGDLRQHSLHELWAHGEPFQRLRALTGNASCWSCRHYDHCGGGCRARALAAGGDLNAPDSWCSYEPVEGAP